MSGTLTLAIDQGTHSTRAVAFDARGRLVAMARRPVSLNARSRALVEQAPDEILASLHAVLGEVLEHPAVAHQRITAAGLATQRSSVLAWDRRTGQALSPVLSWQDTRCAGNLKALGPHQAEIRQHTGLQLSPHYGASKLQWLLEHEAALATACDSGRLIMGPLVSYLLHHLLAGNGDLVDHANASRTLLWNLGQRDWDDWLLGLFGIDRDLLPACRPICADYGVTATGAIPVTAVNGDQTAALYARGQPDPDTIRVNIGTGAFVLMPVTDIEPLPPGLLAGLSQSSADGAEYYFEGTVNGAWAALAWAERRFKVKHTERDLPGWLATIVSPPVFLNTVGGLGAPWWRQGPEPAFLDEPESGAAAMVAVVESIAFLIQANVDILCRLNPRVSAIQVSGGLANLDGLCQRIADLSGLPVQRPPQVEATARGIAWQAAGGPDDWPASGPGETFAPAEYSALFQRQARFLAALERT
jgi:glycerol kinase